MSSIIYRRGMSSPSQCSLIYQCQLKRDLQHPMLCQFGATHTQLHQSISIQNCTMPYCSSPGPMHTALKAYSSPVLTPIPSFLAALPMHLSPDLQHRLAVPGLDPLTHSSAKATQSGILFCTGPGVQLSSSPCCTGSTRGWELMEFPPATF